VIEIIIDFRWWNGPVVLPPEAGDAAPKARSTAWQNCSQFANDARIPSPRGGGFGRNRPDQSAAARSGARDYALDEPRIARERYRWFS